MEQSQEQEYIKIYELTALMKGEDPAVLKNVLQKSGVSLVEEKPVLKMQLSYPIAKEHFAFQSVLCFTGPEEALLSIRNDLNLNQEVLRHVVRVVYPGRKEETRGGFERGNRERMKFGAGHEVREGRKPEILTNEALEKKIEEILQ